MLKSRHIAGVFAILLIAALLTACNPKPGEPTPDAQAIFTAAAQTVQAQLTQTAAAKPTDTPVPTNTTQPTATANLPVGTLVPALPGLPGAPTQQGLPALLPTQPILGLATATIARAPVADKAEWVTQDPEDGTVVDPKSKFDITWTLKNTGTTTWTKEYQYRFYVGDKLYESKTAYNLRSEVKPGESADLIVDGLAPSKEGTYKMAWVITNKDGVNFYVFDITLKVGSTAEPATATPESLDYICSDATRAKDHGTGCTDWCDTGNPALTPCYGDYGTPIR